MFRKVYSTKVNVAANFAGSIWTAVFSIIFVPLYLTYIGIEAYGLIGVFTSIQAFITLLDFGLSPTLNRELARLAAQKDQAQAMTDLKRTLETINWRFAFVIALLGATENIIRRDYYAGVADNERNYCHSVLVEFLRRRAARITETIFSQYH